MRPERADLRPERADLRPERADLRSVGADLRQESAVQGSRELISGLRRKNGKWRNGKLPCVESAIISPSGAAAQKENIS